MRKRMLMIPAAALIFCSAVFSGCTSSPASVSTDSYGYFSVSGDDSAAIVLDCEAKEEQGIVDGGNIYLPWSFVWNEIDAGFYYEESAGTLYLTGENEELSWTENDGTGALIVPDGEPYVSMEVLKDYSAAEIGIFEDPARVVIQTPGRTVSTAKISQDTELSERAGKKGHLTDLAKGDEVILIADENGYSRVSTDDGFTGYVDNASISDSGTRTTGSGEPAADSFQKKSFGSTIGMIWDYIEFTDDNTYLEAMLDQAEGVNVISPTWYAVAGKDGGISSLSGSDGETSPYGDGSSYADEDTSSYAGEDTSPYANGETSTYANGDTSSYAGTGGKGETGSELTGAEYVRKAHEMGMQVWPVLSDLSIDSDTIGGALSDRESRQNIIAALMEEADAFGFDGICLDLEHISEQYVPAFIQFIRELTAAAHEKDLIVSVTDYVPQFTWYYRRDAQIAACDYIAVMAYDEHTGSSDEIGSAASLPFVIEGIEDTLTEVPAECVILGVPFFSRAWTQNFGEEEFSSQALSMEGARNFIKEHGIDAYLYWDQAVGQYYGTSTDDTARYSIWQEEENSLGEKLKLIKEYSLAGAAAWRLGYEEDQVWPVWAEWT